MKFKENTMTILIKEKIWLKVKSLSSIC